MLNELKKFFEDHPLAHKAANSIKNGREIAVVVTKGDQKTLDAHAPLARTTYTFTKVDGRNVLNEQAAASPDITFTMPETAARELVTKNFDTVGQVGLHIFEKMLSNDPSQKIHAKIHAGFLSLMTGGYLGILTSGGGDVAKFLASRGLGSAGKLKETISKLKG